MMFGGAIINAVAFTGGNYLAKYLSGDSGALAEKTRHDKALEAYEAAQARYAHDRTKLLDWIETNRENKEMAKQNFTNTDYAFKLYNQAHPNMTLPKEPKFSDFYQPSEAQKQGEPLFVGGSALALGYAAFRFL